MFNADQIVVTLVFLNEFYNLYNEPFQKYIDKLKISKYHDFCNRIKNIKVYSSLQSLLGLKEFHNEFYFDIYYKTNQNSYNINIELNKKYKEKKIFTLGKQWIMFILSQFQKSNVINYQDLGHRIDIHINLGKIKTSKSTDWQKLFTRLLFLIDKSDIMEKKLSLYPPNKKYDLYPFNELISADWFIDDCFADKLIKTRKALIITNLKGENYIKNEISKWISDLDWERKKKYILVIGKIEKSTNNQFFENFLVLDKNIRTVILNYL